MKTLMIFPPIYITKGVPDSESLENRLHQDGFQKISLVERQLAFQGESLQDYIKRFLRQTSENSISLLYTVGCGQRVLGIPFTGHEAKTMLHLLSGRRHQIWVCFSFKSRGEIYSKTVMTRISFKRLAEAEIKSYLDLNEWQGRSGGYNPLGKAASFIKSVNGSPTVLSGLPEFEWTSFIQGRKF